MDCSIAADTISLGTTLFLIQCTGSFGFSSKYLLLAVSSFYLTTQQGADIIAKEFNAKVVMPDFSRGNNYSIERYDSPPEGVSVKGEVMKQFFDPSYMSTRLDEVKAVAEVLRGEGKTFIGVNALHFLALILDLTLMHLVIDRHSVFAGMYDVTLASQWVAQC